MKFNLKNDSLITLMLSIPAAAGARDALFLPGTAGDLSYLETDEVIILLLSSMVLLLFGVLIRLRQLRIQLERKSASLEKSEQHIRLMSDNLPSATIFQLTHSEKEGFRFTYLSKGCEKLLGIERDSILSNAQLVYDHIYEEDIPALRETFRQSTADLAPGKMELRVLDRQGRLKWQSVSTVPHRTDETVVWDGFIQDISGRKLAEDALVEENRNFQNLFRTIDDLLIVCDSDGRLLHTNPAVVQRLGYSEEALKTMSIFELFAEGSKDDIHQVMTAVQTQPSAGAGMSMQSRNGSSIPVELNTFQGTWRNDRAVFAVARDVAGRRQAEEALRKSQQMLQLIMDTIPMAVFWKDKDSIYLGCNKTFIRDCGFESVEDVVGNNPFDLFPVEQASAVLERDQGVIRNNYPRFHFTHAVTRPDGTVGWRESSKIPLRDEEGRAVGVLGVWRDITEQNRAEERLKRTLEDMERFNQLMRGRERRTLELKSEINALLKQLGKPKKYRTTMDEI